MGPFSNSGGLLFSAGRAGRPDNGNHLESGGIRGNMLTRQTLQGSRPFLWGY